MVTLITCETAPPAVVRFRENEPACEACRVNDAEVAEEVTVPTVTVPAVLAVMLTVAPLRLLPVTASVLWMPTSRLVAE